MQRYFAISENGKTGSNFNHKFLFYFLSRIGDELIHLVLVLLNFDHEE